MDERKEPFQDEFTDNESEAPGAEREDAAETERLDPDVDSQADDDDMEEDRFGVDRERSS